MKTFKELFEADITYKEALKILDITADDAQDEKKLKVKMRKASLKHHPDHGGSEEMQKKVNLAYEKLKSETPGTTTSTKFDWKALDKKYREIGAMIKLDLMAKFKPEKFVEYFNTFSPKKKFQFEITKILPGEKERSPHYAGFTAEFFTKDRKTVFEFSIHVYLTDVVGEKSLGTGDISYKLMVTAYGFHGKQKQKLAQRDWKSTNDHALFADPKKTFTKAKMNKIFKGTAKKRKFARRDMYTFLQKQLKAETDGDFAYIPLTDGYKLIMYRTVFMRQGTWGFNGVYNPKRQKIDSKVYFSFPETEETTEVFENVVKSVKKLKKPTDKSINKTVIDILQKYYDELIAE